MVSRPHGGRLVKRVLPRDRMEDILRDSRGLPQLDVDDTIYRDLENIGYGVYSPLTGFLDSVELESVLYTMRLSNDLPWTIPIVLDIDEEARRSIGIGDTVLLMYGGQPVGLLMVEEVYRYDKDLYAEKVFKTTDPAHPGVARVMSMGDYLVGGSVEYIPMVRDGYEDYFLTPRETRVLFRERGWETVVAFQTRNVPHLGHEYVQKTALTFVDGLFINPVIGRKKRGDFRDEVILEAYKTLINRFYPRGSVVMSIVRYAMRYAGPREAIHHAIMRKNFGATHFIVGRDHAGVGNYYGRYEAQEIFSEFPDLGITPLFFREFFYCRGCGGMSNEKICPHDRDLRIYISGTKIRESLSRGIVPPGEMMRREVAETILSFDNPFVD